MKDWEKREAEENSKLKLTDDFAREKSNKKSQKNQKKEDTHKDSMSNNVFEVAKTHDVKSSSKFEMLPSEKAKEERHQRK